MKMIIIIFVGGLVLVGAGMDHDWAGLVRVAWEKSLDGWDFLAALQILEIHRNATNLAYFFKI